MTRVAINFMSHDYCSQKKYNNRNSNEDLALIVRSKEAVSTVEGINVVSLKQENRSNQCPCKLERAFRINISRHMQLQGTLGLASSFGASDHASYHLLVTLQPSPDLAYLTACIDTITMFALLALLANPSMQVTLHFSKTSFR